MRMNNLCADIGYLSINHAGEQLCGDHVEVIADAEKRSSVIVLADGLGSGVKANILSILTSKIISTMLAEGLRIGDAVETITKTLPVCSVRNVAYSTFTIVQLTDMERAHIIQYDNPEAILLRGGKPVELPNATRTIGGKTVRFCEMPLQCGDIFVLMSDGVEHAGIGGVYNFGWKREDIADYMSTFSTGDFTAKTLASLLLDETNRLYDGQPGDDATACVVKIRERQPVNLMIGPPFHRDDCNRMMALFFSKEGKHIVCGGTTSDIAAKYLGKPVVANLDYLDPEIPPTAEIEGVDLVTEGIITVNRVLEYAKNYLDDNSSYNNWAFKKDGASRIARMLFEDATDINFFVGRAVNPAHQNPDLPINFSIKMKLVEELTNCLKQMGKQIRVSYF